jgi:hypothetical protein
MLETRDQSVLCHQRPRYLAARRACSNSAAPICQRGFPKSCPPNNGHASCVSISRLSALRRACSTRGSTAVSFVLDVKTQQNLITSRLVLSAATISTIYLGQISEEYVMRLKATMFQGLTLAFLPATSSPDRVGNLTPTCSARCRTVQSITR